MVVGQKFIVARGIGHAWRWLAGRPEREADPDLFVSDFPSLCLCSLPRLRVRVAGMTNWLGGKHNGLRGQTNLRRLDSQDTLFDSDATIGSMSDNNIGACPETQQVP